MTHPLAQIVVSFALCAGLSEAAQPDPCETDGLFGWSWGTSRETIARERTLEPLPSSEGGVRRYRADCASLGEANLWEVDFEFVGEKFAGVAIQVRGRRNSRALLRELRLLYGPGLEEDPRGIGWLNPATHARYDEDSAGDAYVYIYAVRLYSGPASAPGRNR